MSGHITSDFPRVITFIKISLDYGYSQSCLFGNNTWDISQTPYTFINAFSTFSPIYYFDGMYYLFVFPHCKIKNIFIDK